MGVGEYRVNRTVLAVLWEGDINALDGFPDLDERDCTVSVSGQLSFQTRSEGKWLSVVPFRYYIVRSSEGVYFLWPKERFNETYTEVTKSDQSQESKDDAGAAAQPG